MHNQNPSVVSQQTECFIALSPSSRVSRKKSILHGITLSILLSSLGLLNLPAHAQELSKKQDKLLSSQSGFLENYSRLKPDPKNSDLLIYMKTPEDFKASTKFIVDPIEVYLLPEGDRRAIDADDLAKLTQNFAQALKDELIAGGYEVVTEPGPGVKTLRIALTNIEPTGAKKNAAVKGAATAASIAVAPGASLLVPRFSVGKVSIEGEIVDSTSNQVEVEFMASKTGKKYFSGLKQYQTWGDINAAFKAWAKGFRRRLNMAIDS